MIRLVYLIFGLYSPSGLERVLTQKANYLARTGRYDITIVTARQKGRRAAYELDPSIKTVDLGANYYSFFGNIAYRRRLKRLLRQINPHVTDSTCGPRLGEIARMSFPGAKIAEFHFSHFSMHTTDTREAVARRFEKAVRHFDKFVVLTSEDADDWKPYTDNIIQIYNPCEISGDIADYSSKHVALIGRLEPQKNLHDALAAWEIVARRHPDWVLDIYGEGRLRTALQDEIQRLSLDGKVLLHGNVKNLHERLLGSSILLMSSLYEGFPLSLLEGAAVGLPLVSYACKCGPSEIIQDGVSGYLVRPGDYNSLSERLCELMESEDKRKIMGTSALESMSRFAPEPVFKAWDNLFTSLAGQAR